MVEASSELYNKLWAITNNLHSTSDGKLNRNTFCSGTEVAPVKCIRGQSAADDTLSGKYHQLQLLAKGYRTKKLRTENLREKMTIAP